MSVDEAVGNLLCSLLYRGYTEEATKREAKKKKEKGKKLYTFKSRMTSYPMYGYNRSSLRYFKTFFYVMVMLLCLVPQLRLGALAAYYEGLLCGILFMYLLCDWKPMVTLQTIKLQMGAIFVQD